MLGRRRCQISDFSFQFSVFGHHLLVFCFLVSGFRCGAWGCQIADTEVDGGDLIVRQVEVREVREIEDVRERHDPIPLQKRERERSLLTTYWSEFT